MTALPPSPRHANLRSLSNRELLDAWTQSLEVLHERGIVRTYNNSIGDIAEEMVARFYGGVRIVATRRAAAEHASISEFIVLDCTQNGW